MMAKKHKFYGLFIYLLGAISLLSGIYLEGSNTIVNVQSAKYAVANLYQDEKQAIPKEDISDQNLLEAYDKIDRVNLPDTSSEMEEKIAKVKEAISFRKQLASFLDKDGVMKDGKESELFYLSLHYSLLDEEIKELFADSMEQLKQQGTRISLLKSQIASFYEDGKLKSNVTREHYQSLRNLLETIPSKTFQDKYQTNLEKIDLELTQREEAERIRKLQEAIQNAYRVIKNIPYINQNQEKIYNGCEVASLLMAAKYKGYWQNVTLKDIAEAVPKTDNPHTGFIESIWEFAPKEIAHWIAPDALDQFAKSYQGGIATRDMTGSTFDDLKSELGKGNPVIVWVTDQFETPKEIPEGKEVPANLHVVLLIGYNEITGDYVVQDPGGLDFTSGEKVIPKAQFESIWQAIGQKAVVIS